jgi:hypothetical protein
MSKLLVGIVASFLLVGSAAAAYKLEPLTNDQREEMRARAEKMREERDAHPMHHKTMHHHMHHHHEAATTS